MFIDNGYTPFLIFYPYLTGSPTKSIIECWDILQVEVAKYINTDLPGVQKPMGAKPIRGLCQRLKGTYKSYQYFFYSLYYLLHATWNI